MLRSLATSAACAIALTLASPLAAHADSRTLVDSAGDVWWHSTDGHTRVPDHQRGDILRVTIRHSQHAVAIRTRFAQLDRNGSRIVVASRLRTSAGLVRWVRLHAGPGSLTWRGQTRFFRADNTTRLDCATTHEIDYVRDLAVVRIPRSCLENPRSVQLAHGVATIPHDGFFADNPFDSGPTERLPDYTSPVRRG
jgi:hypothetical protein